MLIIIKRLPTLALIGVMLACVLYGSSGSLQRSVAATEAATGDTGAATQAVDVVATSAPTTGAALPATRPTVHGTLNGAEIQGIPGSYCWPDASPQCDFLENLQPTTPVVVTNGSAITFSVDPASPAPTQLNAVLLDDGAKKVDLTASAGSLTLDLLALGSHRLEVDAVYTGSVQGETPFVSAVYLLSVSGGNVAAVGTQSGVAVALATVSATEAVPAATEPPTFTPATVEAFTPVPPAPTVEQPTNPAPTVEQPTNMAPTVEQPTIVAPTATVVPPTETLIPPTPVAPTVAAATTEPGAVVTVVVTVVANGQATPVLPPISTANVPPTQLIVGGRAYDYIAVSACSSGEGGSTLCVNRPAEANVSRIVALSNDAAQIQFQGPRPSAILATVYSSDGVKVLRSDPIPPDNLVLYTLPSAPGSYVLGVEITYAQGKATYFYRLEITG